MPDEGNDNLSPTSTPGPGPKKKILTPSAETKPAKDKKKGKKEKPEPTTFGGRLWHNWIKPVGSVILIVVVVRSMLIDWNDVPSGSMEPEIHVGDRIAVNRLAYGLQFPLTGPEIGIPFIGPQFDNPLDGIPQIAWGGGPARGDIVTFWNPVTKVRMVKRIVAIPGDTVEMSGGVLTINGTAATYTDLDAAAEGLPPTTKYFVQDPANPRKKLAQYEPVTYREETLLGETRIIQHIPDRWLMDSQVVEYPDGERSLVDEGFIQRGLWQDGPDYNNELQKNGTKPTVLATAKDGILFIADKRVDYHQFSEALLERYTTGEAADTLAAHGFKIDGHRFFIDDREVPFEAFRGALDKSIQGMSAEEQDKLRGLSQATVLILSRAAMTNYGPVTLGDDQYLMIGDNRNNSTDGRALGPVMRSEITGEAFAVAFSFKDNKMFALPPVPAWKRWFKDLD